MKQLCDIEIQLEGGNSISRNLGETVKGELVIKPHVDLPVSLLGYDLIVEVRGQMRNKSRGVINKSLMWDEELKAGKTYRYPIEFQNSIYESYIGINANILMKFEGYVKIDKSKAKRKGSAIKSFYGMFDFKEKKIQKDLYLNFTSENNQYAVQDKSLHLEIQSLINDLVPMLFFGLFFVFLIASSFEDLLMPIIFLVVGIVFAVIVYYLIGAFFIDEIKAELIDNNLKNFKYEFKNGKKWRTVEKVTASYEIHEKVVDDRGTSNITLDKIRYKSNKIIFEQPIKEAIAVFDFPEGLPGTYSIPDLHTFDDMEIYWLLKVQVIIFFGIKFTFKKEFLVKKVRLNPPKTYPPSATAPHFPKQ